MVTAPPGPWMVTQTYDGSRTVAYLRGVTPIGVYINASADWLGVQMDDATDAQLIAIAHLVAAAPELLAALHVAADTIRALHGIGMGSVEAMAWSLYQQSPEMTAIMAAIQKAEGR